MTPRAVLDHFDRGTLWPALVDDARPTDLAAAYRAALAVRTLRIARGERPVGYKVGFTNRTLWDRYRVYAPIWGVVWDTTLQSCDGTGRVSLQRICQPRLEPEVAFGLRATPPVGATLEQLYDCVDWLSPSFELVQSHCADWTFTAAQTVIDGGLHARLLLGPRTPWCATWLPAARRSTRCLPRCACACSRATR
jgi:2-keto-4-pentenoate hydratase